MKAMGHTATALWLDDIPEHWTRLRLKHLAQFISGGTPETSKLDYWGGSVPWVSPKDMKTLRLTDTQDHITETAVSESATAAVPEGTPLLVVRSGILQHTIPVAVTSRRMSFNQDIKALALKNGLVDPYYFARFVEGHNGQLLREWRKEGTTVESLEVPLIANFEMILPPFDEQQAIARFLDRETARIDALIEKKRRQIELLHEKRAALISHAVTKGLDPTAPMKDSGIDWLGESPAHWQIPPLYARFSVELGKMLDEKRITGEHPLPYVRNVDVQWDHVNVTELPEMDIVPDEYSRYTLKDGDLLVCEGGEVGRTAIWRGELPVCAFQKAIHRMRPLSGQDLPRFFYYVMRATASTGVFVAHGNPNTIPHLTAEKLRVCRFAFPPTEEQRAIVDFLDGETARIDALVGKIDLSIDRLREYRTALISAAVTGKVDVRKEVA